MTRYETYATRAIEQCENLFEYFLAFLPEQKTVAKTLGFERIEKALSDVLTKVFVFVYPAFERFLLTF